MSILPVAYTAQEVDALVAAVRAKLDASADDNRWEVAIAYAQLHMLAGHKAGDI